MKVRKAILAAAEHIEAHPESLDRSTIYIPTERSDRADALSWIGHFLGIKGHAETSAAAARALGLKDTQAFYDRMTAIDSQWESTSTRCAGSLLEYVTRYHREG